ncbi:MAG: response regulator [Proteobacteria bacterium]|nr:response regulator [Pseudomonadota bacterium]
MKVRILIIDDDPQYHKLLARHIKSEWADAEVRSIRKTDCSADGQLIPDGVNASDYHAVLLDRAPSGKDGLKSLREFKRRPGFPPVIFIIDRGNELLAVEAVKAGAEDYLLREEINHDRFIASLRSAIRKHKRTSALLSRRQALDEACRFGAVKIRGHRFIRELGSGGISSVYLAEGDKAKGLVVLKVFRLVPEILEAQNSFDRFIQEYELISRIEHPNIVPVYELGQEQPEKPYYTMRFLRGETLREKSVGVVGCGAIGGRLAARLTAFGTRVLKNDPPLAERAPQAGAPHDFVALSEVLAEADVVTLHVPLTHAGSHATHHLFAKTTLNRLKPGAWLVNTARGAVVSKGALKEALEAGRLDAVVLDVWEHEPTPDPDLLRRVDLATPHVAGYSYDGKVEGTRMLYHALIRHLDLQPTWDDAAALAPAPDDRLALIPPDATLPETAWLDALARQMVDLPAADTRLRRLLTRPPHEHAAFFIDLRKHYPRRRTFRLHTLARHAMPAACLAAVEEGLRVRLVG